MASAPELSYFDRMVVGEQIRAARAMLGWTQRQLAEEAEVPLSAIKSVESDPDARVKLSALAAIERVLVAAGIVFLEDGETRSGGRGLRFAMSDEERASPRRRPIRRLS